MLNELISYLNKNNRLTEHQSGNKAIHSCCCDQVGDVDISLESFMTSPLFRVLRSRQGDTRRTNGPFSS